MHVRLLKRIVGLTTVLAALAFTPPTHAAPFDGRRAQFADDAFRVAWTRADAAQVQSGRTWYWGPTPWFDNAEFLRQGLNGLRTVQYFDKARMEINNPNDRSYQGGVTNGLLVVELVSGHIRQGYEWFDFESRPPADIPVAGDPKESNPDAPTYASFQGVATLDNNGYADPSRVGGRVGTTIDHGGNLGYRQDLADAHPETTITYYEQSTGHNLPRVFRDFLNRKGRYLENGVVRWGLVIDPVFGMGLPISDPYWVRARVGGVEKDVLVQLFQRRALTYVSDNPPGYQVEMGNVGQHYFQWRYPDLGMPWMTGEPATSLVYATDAFTGDHLEVAAHVLPGSVRLTSEAAESVPFSFRRSYDVYRICLLIDSRRGDGTHRQIYQIPMWGSPTCPARRLTYSDGTPPPPGLDPGYLPNGVANDYNPSASPDGTKIVFVSDREGLPQLFIMPAEGGFPMWLNRDGCVSQAPSWSPDGRTLYWERQCSGEKFAIMKGDLAYTGDGKMIFATLVNIRTLTDQGADNRYPRVSPDGSRLAFTSYRDGNAEIYVMNAGGSGVARLTNDPAEDEAPSWSPYGNQLVFASNRDGDYELYIIESDGSGSPAQLTFNSGQDRWPLLRQ